MFIKKTLPIYKTTISCAPSFFPDGTMDKLKVRPVAHVSQQSRHLNDLVSLATVSLQVVYLLFNIASYYKCMLHTVDIRGAFLNAEFTPADKPICLKINKDVVLSSFTYLYLVL